MSNAGDAAAPETGTLESRLADLGAARVVGVLRAASGSAAASAAQAAARGGLRALEVTFTTPDAPAVLAALVQTLPAGVLLGAGTVMSAADAWRAVRAGASFLVSPHLGEDVLEVALEAGVPYLPGVLTPTEVARATRLGASAVKLFPIGSSGGSAYLRDLLGPFPNLRAMVTGGVAPGDVPAYLAAGAFGVGLGSNLFPKRAIDTGDWPAVQAATRQALAEAGLGEAVAG